MRIYAFMLCMVTTAMANPDAKRLYDDLFRRSDYRNILRGDGNVTVTMGLGVSQLIDLNERDLSITLKLQVRQSWTDTRLEWEPKRYGGLVDLSVPSKEIWKPDIVLYNNVDGDFEIKSAVKAILHHTGEVIWNTPFTVESHCQIDVSNFPYDEQNCFLKFGSWTFDGNDLDLALDNNSYDLGDYIGSSEWDLISFDSKKYTRFYPCCLEPYPRLIYELHIRRKTLYFTLNLILPCLTLCVLTPLIFCIPVKSREKMRFGFIILLCSIFFLLMISGLMPVTSLAIPMVGKYLLSTMILVTCSILMTILVLNIHFRTSATHSMSPCLRYLFLKVLPRCLCVQRSPREDDTGSQTNICTCPEKKPKDSSGSEEDDAKGTILQDVTAISNHFKQKKRPLEIDEDWQFMANVLDRLFFWIFAALSLIITCVMLVSATHDAETRF